MIAAWDRPIRQPRNGDGAFPALDGEITLIGKDEMVGVLLDACPSFAPAWNAFLDEWLGEAELPLYVVLANLARHLIGLVERGETAELPTVFRADERWHLEGDEYVRTAATEGLLEDLQNLNLHRARDRAGPVSGHARPRVAAMLGRSRGILGRLLPPPGVPAATTGRT